MAAAYVRRAVELTAQNTENNMPDANAFIAFSHAALALVGKLRGHQVANPSGS